MSCFFSCLCFQIDEDLWPLLKLEEQLEATLFLPLEDHCFFLDSFFFVGGGGNAGRLCEFQ